MREFVLNEASFNVAFGTIQEATEAVSGVLGGMAWLVSKKIAEKILRNSGQYHTQAIADGTTLNSIVISLLNNPKTRDFAKFFRAISHKIPIDVELENEILNRLPFLDIPAENKGALPFLLCWASKHIFVSLPTEKRWDQDQLPIAVRELDGNGEIRNLAEAIDNLARSIHTAAIANRHKVELCKNLTQEEFWNKRSEAFPSLDFGIDVEAQAIAIDVSSFGQIVTSLHELDETCTLWQADNAATHPQYRAKKSGESQSTMQQFGSRRHYKNKDGQTAVYEDHIKIGNSLRIHFIEKHAPKGIEVGYLGRHLPTTSQPT